MKSKIFVLSLTFVVGLCWIGADSVVALAAKPPVRKPAPTKKPPKPLPKRPGMQRPRSASAAVASRPATNTKTHTSALRNRGVARDPGDRPTRVAKMAAGPPAIAPPSQKGVTALAARLKAIPNPKLSATAARRKAIPTPPKKVTVAPKPLPKIPAKSVYQPIPQKMLKKNKPAPQYDILPSAYFKQRVSLKSAQEFGLGSDAANARAEAKAAAGSGARSKPASSSSVNDNYGRLSDVYRK